MPRPAFGPKVSTLVGVLLLVSITHVMAAPLVTANCRDDTGGKSPSSTSPPSALPSSSTPATNSPSPSSNSPSPNSTTLTLVHPGMLHTAADLMRMTTKVADGLEPWKSAFQLLTTNPHASLGWRSTPLPFVYRGNDGAHAQNYVRLYNDAAAAYQLALRWHITGDDAYANKSVAILNGWATTLQAVGGNADRFLATGIYGYQFANAGELMRGYRNWPASEFQAFVDMMLKQFYSVNYDFLVRHNNARIDNYWANWDLCNMASIMVIGILADRPDLFNEAVNYFKHGQGNGVITKAVWILYPDGTGQVQESGRDQGHATLDIGLFGVICQMAYNQGEDLYAYDNNRVLAGAEYIAKYNLGLDVNYTTYRKTGLTQPVISSNARGIVRPMWELLYNHYVVKMKLWAPYTQQWAEKVRPEGGRRQLRHHEWWLRLARLRDARVLTLIGAAVTPR